jgi:hypothetical protein
MYWLCTGPFHEVNGYRDIENAKLVNTARAFELVITENEKQWLKAAFAKGPEQETYDMTKQFLALVDKHILVFALWLANKKYNDNLSVSYSALSQRLGKNWDVRLKLPPVGNEAGYRISDKESLLGLLSRKYPEAYLKVDKMLA